MYSNRSEYRRQHSDRGSRQWEDYDDKWEERREPPRDVQRDSYHKYGGDGQSSTQKTSRSREYSDSPKRLYNKDSLNRDWSRKSPVRRRMSSPDWAASEKKRRMVTQDGEKEYRYRREPEYKTGRKSPDNFSRAYITKNLKHTLPQEEDFKYRKTSQDSRHRYRDEEITYRQQHDDLTCRGSFGYTKARDDHERRCSRERTRSQDRSTKSYAKPRERNDSPAHEDHYQNKRRSFPLNGSSGQSFESDVTNQFAAVPEQKSSTKGFQRFLDVLNKGVNVAMLTKIVTQNATEVDEPPHSPTSFISTADRVWSPSCGGRQQENHQNTSHWSESEGSQRLASPQPRHRSFSPNGRALSDEKSLQRGEGEQNYFSSNSRSGSPSVMEKLTLTPEDEHKHRQMQDVLQAIGLNLGFEELGQMSHRIQERLYGKKDSDGGHHGRRSREWDTRRALSPRPQSRSSSSRSSFSPSTREYYSKKDSYSAKRDVTQAQPAVDYGHHSSSSTLQESKKCETNSRQSIATCQAFSPNPTYTLSKPSPSPVMPVYSPVNCLQAQPAVDYGQKSSSSTLQESKKCETNSQQSIATSPAFSQNPTYTLSEPPPPPVMPVYSPVNCFPLPYPALPPNLPHVRPGLFLPRLPPFLPYPCVPPLNMFPNVLAQTRHLVPQHLSSPRPHFFNLPDTNPPQSLNTTQKPKTMSRPRCLQVIETTQPG